MEYPGSSSNLRGQTEGLKYDDREGYAILDDVSVYTHPYNALVESHKDLPWPNQELNQSYQTSQTLWNYQPQQGLIASTQAGTSDSGRKRGSKNPPALHLLRNNSGKTPVSNEKKKEIDKRYREKCRESKKKMESELYELGQENKILHDENKDLMMEKESINKSLHLAETETKHLNTEIRNLRTNMKSQQIFVDQFLKKLDDVSSNENHRLEIKKLQNEIMILKQNNWEDWLTNKVQLLHEIGNLEHENKFLKVQVDALCEKIHNDLDAGHKKTCNGCSAICEGLD
ncbi:uncharacterized protein LOC120004824 isoform X2 [Tripterygium wilfordii]|uniref:uncharacterized protein LOC120004824 isoform X2 n=1 Tax=Tripterygium wilfordii TaxID=458696 RepID=UPI0018F7E9EB|nr:uncharacterized protein LOC120004824 isoform X2 [Tripterygium wilfordii]